MHEAGKIDAAIAAYEAVLAEQPNHADTLHMLGYATYQRGDLETALSLMNKAIQLNPDSAIYLSNLGFVLHDCDRSAEAVDVLRQAVTVAPKHAPAWSNLSVALCKLGRYEEAAEAGREAIKADPQFVAAHSNLGSALTELRRLEEAVDAYRGAVAVDPDYANGYANLGRVLIQLGREEEGRAALETAAKLRPTDAAILSELARVSSLVKTDDGSMDVDTIGDQGSDMIEVMGPQFVSFGEDGIADTTPGDGLAAAAAPVTEPDITRGDSDYARALEMAERALAMEPNNPDRHVAVSVVHFNNKNYPAAVVAARRALALDPDHVEANGNLGLVLIWLDEYDEAIAVLNKALAARPDWAKARGALGNALLNIGALDEAERELRHTLKDAPHHIMAIGNLGLALQGQLKLDAAIQTFRGGIELDPESGPMHMNLALALLVSGQLEEGWQEYEWRWQCEAFDTKVHDLPHPVWDGTSLEGRSIAITGEQGVGDEIMYAALFPELVAAGVHCVVQTHHRLVPLFKRSFPGVQVCPAGTPPFPMIVNPTIDFQTPAATLCGRLRPTMESMRPQGKYLFADERRAAECRARYDALGPGLKIGIAWRSGNKLNGRQRSAGLEQWDDLLTIPGVQFINLQYGDCTGELAAVKDRLDIDIHQDDTIDPLEDLDGFAAQIEAVDLVISIDNSTVHMAAALGKPTWVLLPNSPDWRWFLDREDSAWYQTIRLFRQQSLNDWPGVFARVIAALKQVIDGNLPAISPRPEPDLPVPGRATPAGAPDLGQGRSDTGGVVVLNDSLHWYRWGRAGTSMAVHQAIKAFGRPLSLVPTHHSYLARHTPQQTGNFDSASFFEAFSEANAGLMRRIRKSEIVMINGQGTLRGTGPEAVNLLYLAYAAKAHLGKNVQIINHSCYPQNDLELSDPVALGIYTKVYRAVDFVAVREHLSFQILEKLDVPATLAFDCLPLYIADNYEAKETRASGDLVIAGSAPVDLSVMPALVDYMRAMRVAGHEIKVLVGAKAFPATDEATFVDALGKAMPEGWTLVDAGSMEEWLDTIADACLLVSGRFHHCIAAAALGTPYVAMDGQGPKMSALMEMLNQDPPLSTDTPTLTAELVSRSQAALANASGQDNTGVMQAMCELGLQNFQGLAALKPVAQSA